MSSSFPPELRIERGGRTALVLPLGERLAVWLAFGACLIEAVGGMLAPGLCQSHSGDLLYAVAGVAFALIALAPVLGMVGCFLSLRALRRGAVDRGQAVRNAVFGALSLVGPWVILLVLFSSDAID